MIAKMNEAMAEYHVSAEEAGSHAGAAETSFVIAYKPQLVREGEMRAGYMGPLTGRYVREGFKAVTPTGVLGDPTKASRDAGARMIDLVVDMCVEMTKKELGS